MPLRAPNNRVEKNSFLANLLTFILSSGALTGCNNQGSEAMEATTKTLTEDPNCLEGCPEGSPSANQVLQRPIYTLSNNPKTKFADWAAYCLTTETIGSGNKKDRNWKADPDLPRSATLEPSDYEGAHETLGTDRGHQVPLGSFGGSEYAYQTNYLSNITPQSKELNQGPWKELEDAERNLTKKRGKVCVVTGPLYEGNKAQLPHSNKEHTIPSGYWKVVAIAQGSRVETFALILGQEAKRNDDFCVAEVSIDKIEEIARLDLFPEMEVERERVMEALSHGDLADDLNCKSKKEDSVGKTKKSKAPTSAPPSDRLTQKAKKPEGFKNAPECKTQCTFIQDFRGKKFNSGSSIPKDLSCADLREADFGGADLSEGYDLTCSDLTGVDLNRVDLGTQGCEKELKNNRKKGAKLSGTTWITGKRQCPSGSVGHCPKEADKTCKK